MTRTLSEENLRSLMKSNLVMKEPRNLMSSGSLKNEFLEPHQLRISQHQAPEGKKKAFKHMSPIMISQSFSKICAQMLESPCGCRGVGTPPQGNRREISPFVHKFGVAASIFKAILIIADFLKL